MNMKQTFLARIRQTAGFTLIELLIVIAIIGILAAVVIIAVNPARQLAQANNAQRSNDANATLNAIGQFSADNTGGIPDPIDTDPTTIQVIGTCGAGATCTSPPVGTTLAAVCANLSAVDLLAAIAGNQEMVPTYITAVPNDPQATAPGVESEYYVNRNGLRITVGTCQAQVPPATAQIAITR